MADEVNLADISVLVPWRTDHGQRARAWDFLRPIWEASPVELCIGVDDDGAPFNRSRALNRAFAQSSRPTVVTYDADCIPDFDRLVAGSSARWAQIFASSAYLSRADTDRVLAGAPASAFAPEVVYPFQSSHLITTRDLWEEIGGMDEGFVGWGGEDAAFQNVLYRVAGHPSEPTGTATFLWHPQADRSPWAANRQRLFEQYNQA